MAKDYTPNKLDLNTFHGGKHYENGQAPDVNDFNKMVEGVAYAQENGGAKLYLHTLTIKTLILWWDYGPTLTFLSTKKEKFLEEVDVDGTIFYTLSRDRIAFGYILKSRLDNVLAEQPWLVRKEGTFWDIYSNPASSTEYKIEFDTKETDYYTISEI